MKKGRAVKVMILLLIILFAVFIGLYLGLSKKTEKKGSTKSPQPEEVKKIKIIDLDSNSRNIAVMYNNISTVWDYQAGLDDAYIVYEMLVEGGYTRLMAIFKDKNLDRIGSVRSSRPYFLDYALENDAIYIHFGASQTALDDIKSLGVDNINFMNYSAGYVRDKSLNLALEHTAFTSSERINKGIDKYQYRNTTTVKPVLDYSVDEIDLSKMDGAIKADEILISFSGVRSTSFTYDPNNKVYLRSQGTAKGNYEHLDGVTKKQYTAKNIITYQLPCKTIDSAGRQAITTTGGGKGYYITDGYAIPITWEKNTRTSQTVYRYVTGEKIKVNDGNTHIEIQPSTRQLKIS